MTGDDGLARALVFDFQRAELSAPDRAMLEYALELTAHPLGADRHVDALARQGFDDRAILDICQVTAYYNYVNRLADGLGVELEPEWDEERMTVTRSEFERLVTEKQR